MSDERPVISKHALQRLVQYLTHLKNLPANAPEHISATTIAEALGLNQVQVRKDLACVAEGGKPRVGYVRKKLLRDIEHFLNYDNLTDAVVVGVGNLGKALLSYANFTDYGLNIVAGFDTDPDLVGSEVGGKRVLDIATLNNICRRLNVRIGIVAVPAPCAQETCDLLVASGIRAVWNFSPANLSAPESVVVKNESIAASFVVLSQMLKNSFAVYGLD